MSTSGHGLDTSSAPSCHGQSLPGCYFHSGALQRMGPSKLSTQLSQSRSCPHSSLVLGITEHQVRKVSKVSSFFMGAHACLHSHRTSGEAGQGWQQTWSQTDGKCSVTSPVPLRDNLQSPDHIAMLGGLPAHPTLASTALAPAVS